MLNIRTCHIDSDAHVNVLVPFFYALRLFMRSSTRPPSPRFATAIMAEASSKSHNYAGSSTEHLSTYTSLDAFAGYGPPDMILSLKDGPDFPVHSLVVMGLSNVLRQVPWTDTADASEVVPLDGDEALSWAQTLIAMYLSMYGASQDDTIKALLVRL